MAAEAPRGLASRYLTAIGRDPAFFESSIFPCTNRGVIRQLRAVGLEPTDARRERLGDPETIGNRWVKRAVEGLGAVGMGRLPPRLAGALLANPLRTAINLEATKPEKR